MDEPVHVRLGISPRHPIHQGTHGVQRLEEQVGQVPGDGPLLFLDGHQDILHPVGQAADLHQPHHLGRTLQGVRVPED